MVIGFTLGVGIDELIVELDCLGVVALLELVIGQLHIV